VSAIHSLTITAAETMVVVTTVVTTVAVTTTKVEMVHAVADGAEVEVEVLPIVTVTTVAATMEMVHAVADGAKVEVEQVKVVEEGDLKAVLLDLPAPGVATAVNAQFEI